MLDTVVDSRGAPVYIDARDLVRKWILTQGSDVYGLGVRPGDSKSIESIGDYLAISAREENV